MPRRKITIEQSHELLQIYLHMGTDVSARECLERGVCAKYAAALAASLGMGRRPMWRAGNRYKNDRVNMPLPKSHLDPRWSWAVERGSVVA